MTEQQRRRWKTMVRLAREARQEGKMTIPIDVDLLMMTDAFIVSMCKDIIYERGEHNCPS